LLARDLGCQVRSFAASLRDEFFFEKFTLDTPNHASTLTYMFCVKRSFHQNMSQATKVDLVSDNMQVKQE
jgi:hypothetical protein